MAVSLVMIVTAAASLGGGFDSAQTAYMHCLSNEVDAAVSRRVESAAFAGGAPRVCEAETATYRRMAVAQMVGQGLDGASPDAAVKRFEAFDRSNRAEMIATFESRMRLRRGPSRVAGLPVRAGQD